METYRLSCINYTEIQNSNARKTKQTMLLLNCAVCSKKKSTFIENKELHNFN